MYVLRLHLWSCCDINRVKFTNTRINVIRLTVSLWCICEQIRRWLTLLLPGTISDLLRLFFVVFCVKQYYLSDQIFHSVMFLLDICTVWVKPPEDLWQFFQNVWEFFNQILYAYYAFLSTLEYEFLFNYLQLWWSYATLSVTTQFTSRAQNVHHRPKHTLAFSDIFPKQLWILVQTLHAY